MNIKYSISVAYQNSNHTVYETIDAIKASGFRSVFLKWYDKDWEITQQMQADYCRQLGLHIQFAHLGYQKVDNIWLNDPEYDSFVDRYIKDLDDCRKYGIKLVVMHASGYHPKELSDTGLNRFRKIVEHAKETGMQIAFENTFDVRHAEYVLDNLASEFDNISLCFDSGHYHAYNHDDWDYSKYRVSCIHLHDNDGEEDSHLLPYDGNTDWNRIMKDLSKNGYKGPVTLEVMYQNDYAESMDMSDFYRKAYRTAKKLDREK